MKKNVFKIKEKRKKRIVLEEYVANNSILLFLLVFLKKRKKQIFISLSMLIVCLLLVSIGLAFSLFRGSNDYDITYISGSDEITSNNDPNIDDEEVEEELLGEIAREDGVVVLVDSFMTKSGDVIYYFTDKSSIIITSKGKIYRVSSSDDGKYGIDRNGKINSTAVKVLVTSTVSTLNDGTVVTYYSDGTALVELNGKIIFVRDSNNIIIGEDNVFNSVKPSGVALTKGVSRTSNGIVNTFSDGTTLVSNQGEVFLINKNTNSYIEGGNIVYDKNNIYHAISVKSYSDGNTLTHFSNGGVIITDKSGKVIYVKNSADLVLKKKELYEIVPGIKAISVNTKKCFDNVNVTYFNNGAAIVIYPNNDRKYVEDSDTIIFGSNKNIVSDFDSVKLIGVMLTNKGEKVYSFDNGKSQVIKNDNSSYIVDTDSLDLKPIVDDKEEAEGEEDDKDEELEEDKPSDEGTIIPPIDPTEGIYVTEAEHEYEDPLDVQSTVFTIKNDSTINKNLRITIDEVDDYLKYNTSRLDPKFVKFQTTVGDDYVPASHLADKTWIDEEGDVNYVIYDGILKAKSTVVVAISLYVDYSMLDNSHQDKGFRGTIKVFVDG